MAKTTFPDLDGVGTTDQVSTFTTDNDSYLELPDVSFRNILVMVAITVLMLPQLLHIPVETIQDRLFRGVPPEWTRRRLIKEPMPLYIYSIVERNLAKLLGNPAELLSAAMFGSVRADFGEKTLWVFSALLAVTRFIAPLIATPAFYFQRILPAVSLLYNRNKITEILEVSWRRAVVRYTRAQFAGKILRRPQSDVFSMLWWMPGFTAGVVTFWHKEGARVVHQLVELHVTDVFLACADFITGHPLPQVVDNRLLLNGQLIAVRVKLYAQANGDGQRYYSALDYGHSCDPTDWRYGWLIRQDVKVSTRQGKTWTILHENEVYCAEAGCSIVEYHYQPPGVRGGIAWLVAVISTLFTPLHWLLGTVVGWCVRYLDSQALRDWRTAEAEEVTMTLELFGREHFASRDEMNASLRGEVPEINLGTCVVLRLDFAGHTARRNAMGMRELRAVLRPFWEVLFDFDINPLVQRGRLPRTLHFGDVVVRFGNHTGDGGYVFIYNAPRMTLVQIAVILAHQLHEAAEQVWQGSTYPPLPLRVTITEGEVDLVAHGRRRNLADPEDHRRVLVRSFAEGVPLDNCARLDAVAKTLTLRARDLGQTAHWMTLMPKELFAGAEHHGICGYEDLGVVDVRDMGETHLVRVVHKEEHQVDWSR
jgi:hypothetical protein